MLKSEIFSESISYDQCDKCDIEAKKFDEQTNFSCGVSNLKYFQGHGGSKICN
jgi:hypothetical protein